MGRVELEADALPVVLRKSLRGRAITAVVGAWWTFIAGVGAALAAGRGADASTGVRVWGVLIVAGAAPLALYWLLQLVPGSCRMVVAPDGLHIRHAFVPRRLPWEEIDRFYVRRIWLNWGFEWRGVAFVPRGGYRAGVRHLLAIALHLHGVLRTDMLPDTYGIDAGRLSSFLNAADRRWSGEKAAARRPRELPATRPVIVLVGFVLAATAAFLFLAAAASAADGNWGGAIVSLLLGAMLVPAVVALARRWRRPTLRS